MMLIMYSRRVVVAIELRSYREAIARAVRSMRPAVEVYETEPEKLDVEVARLRPDFVVCSKVTPVIESCVPVWVELYPNCKGHSRVSFSGESITVTDIQLPDLLTLVDQPQDLPALS